MRIVQSSSGPPWLVQLTHTEVKELFNPLNYPEQYASSTLFLELLWQIRSSSTNRDIVISITDMLTLIGLQHAPQN